MRPITFIAVAFILTTLIGCLNGGTTPPPQGDTPTQVLELIEESFNRQDISVLDAVLSDDFVFYFDPNNVGEAVGGYIIPESWGREDFMKACVNMFEEAYSVNLSIITSNFEDPEEGAPTFTANNVPISVLVMVDAYNGFQADGPCDFKFVNDTSAGYDDWKVSKWYDRTWRYRTWSAGSTGLSSTGPPSFGIILAGFY